MTIAEHIKAKQSGSSWIRKMFEEGAHLKKLYGSQNVYDFSLGNPNLKPPETFTSALQDIVLASQGRDHGYMPNVGYPDARRAVADQLTIEQQVHVTENEVVMTCGAAGALNVILKALLDPGDEVIAPAPYFVEYTFYADNHGGTLKIVSTTSNFDLDIDAIAAAITVKTKAVLINSPNNPTGHVYAKDRIDQLGALLKAKGKALERTIYLISDEPYRKIVYDDISVPSIFTSYEESVITSSYSKDISIPGERIGFLAVNPNARFKNDLLGGMALANRVLGFVNAPALMQRVIASLQGASVDISAYARKRDFLCDGLADSGYDFTRPAGAFYLFPKTPISDDVKFVKTLQEERVLVVPGSGFGGPGHFRIAFCVDDETIINAMPGFKRTMEKFR
ncbi:MAG: pyridoxal phosphate-dependent aminotransferase [Desulfobacterales bacterium]|nr:MAG: pyridoxal phosphate-dependent aminotransferase [Desulfobacterales bacterium]